jgi:DNA repair exonuclease SbcCD ATPase subunit
MLINISLVNFKGFFEKSVDFNGLHTAILGRNGSGKSTIVDAFIWCLLGKTPNGDIVTPLDENNAYIDGKTVVTIEFSDGLTFQRTESRTKRGGITQERFLNGLKSTQADFDKKLSECFSNNFALVLNIPSFFGKNTADKRQFLLSILKQRGFHFDLSDKKALLGAFSIEERKEQLKKEVKDLQKTATEMPIKIKTKKELIKEFDFAAIESQRNQLQSELNTILSAKQGNSEKQLQLDKINNQIVEFFKEKEAALDEYSAYSQKLCSQKSENERYKQRRDYINASIDQQTRDLRNLFTQWTAENEKQIQLDTKENCPLCGKPYTADEMAAMKQKEIDHFNEEKTKILDSITSQANAKKTSIDSLKQELSSIPKPECEITILPFELWKPELAEKEKQLNAEKSRVMAMPNEIATIDTQRVEELKHEIDNLNIQLAAKSANEELRKGIAELESRHESIVAKLNTAEQNLEVVVNLERERNNAIEKEISNLFSGISFKLFEKNVSTDGYKDVCECIINGIPYDNLNTANKVNTQIKFANAISALFNIQFPIFIDNKESVLSLEPTDLQLITMQVADTDLTIKTL